MSKQSNQKLKLVYILDILKKYSDEDNPLNATDICRYLENFDIFAERKAIYNDIACLELYGADIIKSSGKKRGWFIGDREFEIAEIYLLYDAVLSAKFISAKKTRELLSKLNGMLSVNQAKRRKNSVYFSVPEKSGNEVLYYSIDAISRAIECKQQVKISYFNRYFDPERNVVRSEKEMIINPYALCWQEDHYYLVGNHTKYDNLIHLRLDRIASAEVLNTPARHFSEVCDYTDFFDTADYTNKLFGMHGGEIATVELKCNKKITEQVLDRFGEDIFITNVTENHFKIRVNAAVSEALVTWVINYGENLTVIKPDSLKEMIKTRAMTVLNNYTDGEKT